jgi:hypothetical protein
LELALKNGTWQGLLLKMVAAAAQREYEEELGRSAIGREYLKARAKPGQSKHAF